MTYDVTREGAHEADLHTETAEIDLLDCLLVKYNILIEYLKLFKLTATYTIAYHTGSHKLIK